MSFKSGVLLMPNKLAIFSLLFSVLYDNNIIGSNSPLTPFYGRTDSSFGKRGLMNYLLLCVNVYVAFDWTCGASIGCWKSSAKSPLAVYHCAMIFDEIRNFLYVSSLCSTTD